MKSRISLILREIEQKKKELKIEYEKLMERYDFSFKKWKVVFSETAKDKYKKYKKSLLKTIFWAKIRFIISIPFIYWMIIPAIILDIFIFIYQNTAIRLYWIPLVKRSDFIVYDRRHLVYLNLIQKVNCLYCSYVNWLFSYAVEVGWRTEKFWCPIKNATKVKWWHTWQKYFVDYWDVDWFKDIYCSNKEYFENDENLEEKKD